MCGYGVIWVLLHATSLHPTLVLTDLAMVDEDTRSIWRLELPSMDEGESASFDLDYDSSEEARYEQEAIAANEDLEELMALSTDSNASAVPSSVSSFRWRLQLPQIYYNTLLPENVDLGCFQPRSSLEADAKKALLRGLMPGDLVARLAEELPSSLRSIHGCGNFGSRLAPKAFTAGAFIHGPHAGLHTVTMEYELAVLVLVSVVRGMRPGMAFSTISLLRNIQASMRRDCHNHAQTCNFVLPMTQFSGGEIFVEDQYGMSRMGPWSLAGTVFPLLVDSEPSPVEFSPRLWHCIIISRGEENGSF